MSMPSARHGLGKRFKRLPCHPAGRIDSATTVSTKIGGKSGRRDQLDRPENGGLPFPQASNYDFDRMAAESLSYIEV